MAILPHRVAAPTCGGGIGGTNLIIPNTNFAQASSAHRGPSSALGVSQLCAWVRELMAPPGARRYGVFFGWKQIGWCINCWPFPLETRMYVLRA